MRNNYGVTEILKNIVSLVYTKMFFPKARLLRRPIYIRGKRYLKYGIGLTTGYNCRIEMFDTGFGDNNKIEIGKNCKIGDCVHIAAGEKVYIGDNCLMASKIYISDITHGNYSGEDEHSKPNQAPDKRVLFTRKIFIGKNVWIGENVCILPGVKIGDGCVIGANSVVNKDIPDNCIAVGSPAKAIKKYNKNTEKWELVADSF